MGGVDRQDQVQSQPSQRTIRPVVGRRSPRILSLSASSRSLSSCSDESCSVCSPKGKAPKKPPSPVARPRYRTPRSRRWSSGYGQEKCWRECLRPCPMGEKGASHSCLKTGETVSTKRFNRKKELVKNGNENMICGAAQAVERVVGVVCASAKKRRKSQTVRHNKVYRELEDTALLAKLAVGNMMAIESFTGYNNVPTFTGRAKKTAWDTWKAFPAVNDAFHELLSMPSAIRSSSSNMCRAIENIPPGQLLEPAIAQGSRSARALWVGLDKGYN
uniref:Uncharacterized protein n=1 Tax=Timema shepardi TaxID=629360 RepID=A0A7R9AY60_TIMSH|nr:unnamed protein product [Timema shepardi]